MKSFHLGFKTVEIVLSLSYVVFSTNSFFRKSCVDSVSFHGLCFLIWHVIFLVPVLVQDTTVLVQVQLK